MLEREGALRRLQQRSPLPEPAEVEEGPAFLGSDVDGLFRPEVVERFGSLYEVNDLLLTPPPRRGWWWAGWAALAGAAVWALG